MKKYYTMQECFEACEDDDIPYIEGSFNIGYIRPKKSIMGKQKDYLFTVDDAFSDKWQIKRAEPKVLSPKEILKKVSESEPQTLQWKKRDIEYAIELADQNGQLREWLRPEQIKLRNIVEDFCNQLSVSLRYRNNEVIQSWVYHFKRVLECL